VSCASLAIEGTLIRKRAQVETKFSVVRAFVDTVWIAV
jgi:hypothetical protein